MERFGCPPKYINMIIQQHEDQHVQVRRNSDLTEYFPINNEVK